MASTGYQTARKNHLHNDIISLIEAAIKDLSGKVKSNAIKQLCKKNPNVRSALEVQKTLMFERIKNIDEKNMILFPMMI